MQSGLTTLLEGVIDYAGLFPPAKLDMAASVEEFIELRRGPHNWLVSRFAVAASRLPDLGRELEKHELDEVFPLAVIGTGSHEPHHWKGALDHDLAGIKQFAAAFGDRAYIEAFEVMIPHNAIIEDAIRGLKPFEIEDLFIELPWGAGMEDAVASLAGCETVFAKARTGGAEASAYPSSEKLAVFLQHCVQLDLPFKLTAGLHQPFPHVEKSTGGHAHGFVNALAGVALAYQEDLTVAELQEVLEETDPSEFEFTEEGLTWGDVEVPLETLEESRELFLSFGSCSVVEPAEALLAVSKS